MSDTLIFDTVFQLEDPRNRMIFDLAALVHEQDWMGAGSFYAAFARNTKPDTPNPKDEDEVKVVLTNLVHWCLNNNRYALAARLLWTETLFDARPHFTQLVWDGWANHSSVMFMGSASASKSYSSGVWLLLDWIRDPENTSVKLLGPSEKHLADNLFTHMINLHENASIALPGEVGDLWIGVNRRNRSGAITGVVVPVGRKSAGRLQGTKAGKRTKPHPIFGDQRRLRVFMDESEKIPGGIWKDVDNIFSNVAGIETFKIGCAFNPENQNGESGTRCEPIGGWGKFLIDTDETWKSRRGWYVVRLDGFRGENIIHKRTIFPGLQTWEGIERVIENAGGYNSPGYYTMARAAFPPTNASLKVISQGTYDQAKGSFLFMSTPTPVGGCDLALQGGDAIPFYLGEFGEAIGFKKLPTKDFPLGEEIYFRDEQNGQITRPGLNIIQRFAIDRGNTVEVAKQIYELAKKLGIQPGWLAVDKTGSGEGIYDVICSEWSSEVIGVGYSESASDSKILEEDQATAIERYDRIHTELWFAMKAWLDFLCVRVSAALDAPKLAHELTDREYNPGKLNRVESKKEFKKRNADKSPDDADAFSLVIHAARKASSSIPSMKLTKGTASGWNTRSEESHQLGKTDITNRYDDLD